MRSVDELLAEARHLSPRDQRQLRRKLASLKASGGKPEGPYASLLALAGTGHTDFPDASTRKGKHLAVAYAPKRARK
jgi:hypothetical protein